MTDKELRAAIDKNLDDLGLVYCAKTSEDMFLEAEAIEAGWLELSGRQAALKFVGPKLSPEQWDQKMTDLCYQWLYLWTHCPHWIFEEGRCQICGIHTR